MTLHNVLLTLLVTWVSVVVLYLLFLCYASYHMARRAGREIPLTSMIIMGPPVALLGYPLDVFLNTVVASFLFLEVPWKETWKVWLWTFTARIIRWRGRWGLRGRMARYFARQLEWADPGHTS